MKGSGWGRWVGVGNHRQWMGQELPETVFDTLLQEASSAREVFWESVARPFIQICFDLCPALNKRLSQLMATRTSARSTLRSLPSQQRLRIRPGIRSMSDDGSIQTAAGPSRRSQQRGNERRPSTASVHQMAMED